MTSRKFKWYDHLRRVKDGVPQCCIPHTFPILDERCNDVMHPSPAMSCERYKTSRGASKHKTQVEEIQDRRI